MSPSWKIPEWGPPNPLADGHIEGQNPATPERMPGHTAYFSDDERSPALAGARVLDGRPIFLLVSGWTGNQHTLTPALPRARLRNGRHR